ncbi:MAG: GTPase Era [Acidobacteria bacterium]|nr:GTPase Era [Acidobacteriota bacterium]NIM62134.1 GTPase Era [Acidobacteriota bacterium]NIO59788.1 GTPase Era [Acidobacteriota bacterium]NIQ30871.1 GTPase Era [Acidobacteriota bacterium]NIQ85944.1 GTPase Era [Acidobacteriota bacterium]
MSSARSGTVALTGWTNVGKSTLLNRLVGAKIAAVAGAAQTTRHRITGVLHLEGRGQIAFVDTPGWHRPRHRMNRRMVELTRSTLGGVDCVAWLIDASRGLGSGDREVAETLRRLESPKVAVLNKIDLVSRKSKLLPMMQEIAGWSTFAEIVPICAATGDGCDDLVEVLLAQLPAGPPLYDREFLTDQSQRQRVSELVREQLVRHTREELPHATAVVIDGWNESDSEVTRITATVLVDRDSQKKIVIGSQGSVLKKVGSAARVEIERLLGSRVFLELWVKVRQDWREDEHTLREIGLS